MKGCLITGVIVLIVVAVINSLLPPVDENISNEPTIKIIDGIEYIEKPIEKSKKSEQKVKKNESLNYVEAGSVEFFAEQGPEEFESKRDSLARYSNAEDFAEYLYNNPPDRMRQRFLGEIIVIHGEVDRVNDDGDYLEIEVQFFKGDRMRFGKFWFKNESFPFAKGCQPNDYILLKGTVTSIFGWANTTRLSDSKIHYNFGPIEN